MKRESFRRTLCLIGLALPAVLSGCASYHYSQVSGQRFIVTNIDTFPVVINRIDGRSPLSGEPIIPVEPGRRVFEVQGPPNVTNPGEFRSITIDVKPCTRYYIVAFKPNRLESDFTPRIDHEMPVPGCTPPTQGSYK
jgi:hypothetical protein